MYYTIKLVIYLLQMNVDNCVKALVALRDGTSQKTLFADKFQEDFVDGVFKQNHVIKKSKYSFLSTKQKFIQAVIDNITKR